MSRPNERAQVRRLRKQRNESGIRQFHALGLKAGTTLPEMAVNINGDLGVKDWRSDPAAGVTQRMTLEEKREAARRMNAYPKLVAALKAHRAAFANCNGKAVWREAHAAADELLAQIGEAS